MALSYDVVIILELMVSRNFPTRIGTVQCSIFFSTPKAEEIVAFMRGHETQVVLKSAQSEGGLAGSYTDPRIRHIVLSFGGHCQELAVSSMQKATK